MYTTGTGTGMAVGPYRSDQRRRRSCIYNRLTTMAN